MEEDMDFMDSEAASLRAAKTSGRVRKKSAKVLEMEEAEKLEKKLSKKETPRQTHANKRMRTKSGSGSDTAAQPISPGSAGLVQSAISPLAEEPSGTGVQLLYNEPEEVSPEQKSPQLGNLISKLKMTLGNPAHLASEQMDSSKLVKKGKTPGKGQAQLQETTSPVAEGEGSLKMKLSLSPSGGEASVMAEKVGTKPKKKKAQTMEEGPILTSKLKTPKSVKKKTKKNPVLEQNSPPLTAAPELLSALGMPPPDQGVSAFQTDEEDEASPPKKKVKKSSASKKKASKMAKGEATQAAQFNLAILKSALHSVVAGQSGMLPTSPQGAPHYADTAEMAMRLKTSSEKKLSKEKKGKKPGKEDTEKPKRKRAPTAYMMWCNTYRSKVVQENPGIDFAQISKRLGEIWQALPEKEKLGWKRKSKRQAAKAATGKSSLSSKVTAAKGAAPSAHIAKSSTLHRGGGTIPTSSQMKTQQIATAASVVNQPVAAGGDVFAGHKTTACSPIDVAAHLKLLGESLSIIGARLQEHQGKIAVQGSLSVLLDSLVCALGPLTCLTSQVPELDACPAEIHNKTLDNIAFIMPGIG